MRKIISSIIVISLIIPAGYMFLEPQLINGEWGTLFASPADAVSTTTLTTVSLTVTGEINLNCSSTAAFATQIAGQTGGIATTTFGCVVETNNSTGYNLKLKKNQKLMIADVANQRFDDYTTTSVADYNWGDVGSSNEEFGFCVNSGTDTVQKYKNNGSICNTSTAPTVFHCFNAIPTSPGEEEVANRASATSVGGNTTVFGLQAQAGGSNNLQSGTYYTTTTATATTNP